MSGPSSREDDAFGEIHELAYGCLSGAATGEECARLERLITSSEQARSLYVQYIHDSVTFHTLAQAPVGSGSGGEGFPSEALIDAVLNGESGCAIPAASGTLRLAEDGTVHAEIGRPTTRQSASASQRRPWRGRTLVLGFAAATVALGILALLPWRSSQARATPQRAARLNRATNVSWSRDGRPIGSMAGEWLLTGRYTLEEGIAQIAFPWGTEVTLQAPAAFELQPNDVRRLQYGQLVARVAPEDTGFTIDTPAVKVIDLGTEFGLLVARDGQSEVHVFKGEVEARQAGAAMAAAPSLKLTAGQAVSFDSQRPTSQEVIYNPNSFSRAWQAATRVTETRGAVRFVHPQPASVTEGSAESNEAILLFLERERATLSAVTAVTITQPGLYTTFIDRAVWLPAGLTVDSYLLHFDPVGSAREQPPVTCEGSATFDHPIIAVITRGDQLAASDRFCACPGTRYQISCVRETPFTSCSIRGLDGLWSPNVVVPAPNDRIRLSPDRKTLTVQMTAGGEADQMRVLVASNESDELPKWATGSIGSPEPYHGRPYKVLETIEAEDFDDGGDGVAYYDGTPNSLATCYRLDSSVEFLPFAEDDEPGVCVALASEREWIGYTVEIERAGKYVVTARVASSNGGGAVHFEFGELPPTALLDFPKTPTPLSFVTLRTQPIELPAGRLFMRVVVDRHSLGKRWVGNMDWFRIDPVTAD